MNYEQEGFDGYLAGERPIEIVARLCLSWQRHETETKQVLAGYDAAANLDRATRPQVAA